MPGRIGQAAARQTTERGVVRLRLLAEEQQTIGRAAVRWRQRAEERRIGRAAGRQRRRPLKECC